MSCSLLGAGPLVDYLEGGLVSAPARRAPRGLAEECLGACDQAPCLMINSEHDGNLDRAGIDALWRGWSEMAEDKIFTGDLGAESSAISIIIAGAEDIRPQRKPCG